MKGILKFILAAGMIGLIAVPAIWVLRQNGAVSAQEPENEEAIKVPARVSRNDAGETVVHFDRETQARIGLKTEGLKSATLVPEVIAYGKLQEDPSEVFMLRSPVAGTLRRLDNQDWPVIGQVLTNGVTVGAVEPRFAPVERVTLMDRLATARADLAANGASLAAAQSAFERARTLNADNKNISDRALQEAEARLKGEQARYEAAGETVNLLESSLKTASVSSVSTALVVSRGGEVVEVMAQPGEAIESGQPILRVSRFDRLIARVDVPPGQQVSTSVSTARIVATGLEESPVRGERIALGPAIDPAVQGQPFLFRIPNRGLALRPGLAVRAYLRTPGALRKGAIIPRSSLVHAAGRTWVYVQTGDDLFVRREVVPETLLEGGWFTAQAFAAGNQVVTIGAQVLLSEESKSQIHVGEEGSGG